MEGVRAELYTPDGAGDDLAFCWFLHRGLRFSWYVKH